MRDPVGIGNQRETRRRAHRAAQRRRHLHAHARWKLAPRRHLLRQLLARHVPRAMVIGVLTVLGVYLLLNLAFVRVLGIAGIAGESFVAARAAQAVFGATGEQVVNVIMLVTLVGVKAATSAQEPSASSQAPRGLARAAEELVSSPSPWSRSGCRRCANRCGWNSSACNAKRA